MERFRTFTTSGKAVQWVDEELCMILDKVSGEPVRFARYNEAIGTLFEAKQFLSLHDRYYSGRCVIAVLNCVASHEIDRGMG